MKKGLKFIKLLSAFFLLISSFSYAGDATGIFQDDSNNKTFSNEFDGKFPYKSIRPQYNNFTNKRLSDAQYQEDLQARKLDLKARKADIKPLDCQSSYAAEFEMDAIVTGIFDKDFVMDTEQLLAQLAIAYKMCEIQPIIKDNLKVLKKIKAANQW